jgi:hypothetical protein
MLAMLQVTTREKRLRPGLWDWVARLNYGGQKSECQGPRQWCYYSGATGLDVDCRLESKRKLSYGLGMCKVCKSLKQMYMKDCWIPSYVACRNLPPRFFLNVFSVFADAEEPM